MCKAQFISILQHHHHCTTNPHQPNPTTLPLTLSISLSVSSAIQKESVGVQFKAFSFTEAEVFDIQFI